MSTDEKPTVEIPAVPDWAVKMTERMLSEFVKTNANIALVSGEVGVVKERLAVVEDWKRKQEAIPSVPPLTSERVREIADQPSKPDLALQAAQAAEILKNQERDKKIEETHEMAVKAIETLKEQSDFMGMGKRGAQWVVSKEGRTVMAQIGAALVCAYEFFKHSGVIK